MEIGASFLITSILLGVGLSMDAFSVSVANGLNEPRMRTSKMLLISGTFATFQGIMPLVGWFAITATIGTFDVLNGLVPWIAMIVLVVIGCRMIANSFLYKPWEIPTLGAAALIIQAFATSIDALSIGFTITEYDIVGALICSGIIAAITWTICTIGLIAGKKLKSKFTERANAFGGIILILIGLKILIDSLVV